jgi:hypothetical protein
MKRMSRETTTPAPAPVHAPEPRTRSLAELAAEQGLTGPLDLDAVFGAGADLWNDEGDFEVFLANELAAEQGLTGPHDLDAVFGAGADLWNDEGDFEVFLANLRPHWSRHWRVRMTTFASRRSSDSATWAARPHRRPRRWRTTRENRTVRPRPRP